MMTFIENLRRLSISETEDKKDITCDLTQIKDPLLNHKNAQLNCYLQITATCKTLSENRFVPILEKTILLNHLFSNALVKNSSLFIQKIEKSEKLAKEVFLRTRFQNEYHHIELCLLFRQKTLFDYTSFTIVAGKFPKITELRFANDCVVTCKELFDAVNLCTNLIKLHMPDNVSDYSVESESKKIPQSVKSLKVSRNIASSDLLAIVNRSINLEKLDLSNSDADKSFFSNVCYPDSLRRLNLDETHLSDKTLPRVINQCSNLEWLSIRKCTGVTEHVIETTAFPAGLEVRFEEGRAPT